MSYLNFNPFDFSSLQENSHQLINADKPLAAKPAASSVVVVEQQFESSFTELPPPSKVMTAEPPPTLPKPIASHGSQLPATYAVPPPPPPSMTAAQTSVPSSSASSVNSFSATPVTSITKSTDLFGAVPFQTTVAPISGSSAAVAGQPPLQIISLKPVNHGQTAAVAGPPPVAPKPVIQAAAAISAAKPIISVQQPPAIAPKPITTVQKSAVPAVPQSPPSPSVVKSGTVVLLQKSNSSKLKKAKVVAKKKYEVDESDDEVDGLLDQPDLLMDETELTGVVGVVLDGKKDKKEKKKDKKVCNSFFVEFIFYVF